MLIFTVPATLSLDEKFIYSDSKIRKLRKENKPDHGRQTGAKLTQIKTFCKRVEIILLTVNENGYIAAWTFLQPLANFKKSVMYETGKVLGMFANRKTALIKAERDMCRWHLDNSVKLFPKAKYIVSFGVGYAFNKEKYKLADVLVSNKICDFVDWKLNEDREINRYLQSKFCNVTDCDHFEVSKSTKGKRYSEIYCGSICSYPTLLNDQELRDKFCRMVATKAIGWEMEGGVLLQFQREEKIKGFIIVKGVSDYGGGSDCGDRKEEREREFTASMAALHYVKSKLEVPDY